MNERYLYLILGFLGGVGFGYGLRLLVAALLRYSEDRLAREAYFRRYPNYRPPGS